MLGFNRGDFDINNFKKSLIFVTFILNYVFNFLNKNHEDLKTNSNLCSKFNPLFPRPTPLFGFWVVLRVFSICCSQLKTPNYHQI